VPTSPASSERIEACFSDAVVISEASFITKNYVTFGREARIQTQEAVPIWKDSADNRMSSIYVRHCNIAACSTLSRTACLAILTEPI
jgi:hypothetical protein